MKNADFIQLLRLVFVMTIYFTTYCISELEDTMISNKEVSASIYTRVNNASNTIGATAVVNTFSGGVDSVSAGRRYFEYKEFT